MPILTPEERIGKVVAGRYELESIVGVGGMGVVFSGTHTWTGRKVAVKILAPEFSRDKRVVDRFLQEARTAAKLRHPNVVDVLDMGADEDGTVFLVLELLEGEPLCNLMEREGPLSPEKTLHYLLPVMTALGAAHRRGIVHRDIKPDNIFISEDAAGRIVPKLLDFGIAKVIEGAKSGTITGTVIGTPYYMSPEQAAASGNIGPSADVWSMGVVLYEALTNALPFTGASPTAVLLSIAVGKPVHLSERAPHLPAALTAAIDAALIPDRRLRYGSMREFIDALLSAADTEGIPVNVRVHNRSSLPPREPTLPFALDAGAVTIAASPDGESSEEAEASGGAWQRVRSRPALLMGSAAGAVLLAVIGLVVAFAGDASPTEASEPAPAQDVGRAPTEVQAPEPADDVGALPSEEPATEEAGERAPADDGGDVPPTNADEPPTAGAGEVTEPENESQAADVVADREPSSRNTRATRERRAVRERTIRRRASMRTQQRRSGSRDRATLLREW